MVISIVYTIWYPMAVDVVSVVKKVGCSQAEKQQA